jgi:DNA modification methylase
MKHIEDICVFSKNGAKVNYYPIMQERADGGLKTPYHTSSKTSNETMGNMARNNANKEYDKNLKFPENIQTFNNRERGARGRHPTQKPITLMEYLIHQRYSIRFYNGQLACKKTNRSFIGIEL